MINSELGKWLIQFVHVYRTHFSQVICGWSMKYVIQLRNVARTTINHQIIPQPQDDQGSVNTNAPEFVGHLIV